MNDNSICIGEKPFLNYVTGIVLQFTLNEEERVVVKARGKHIARAVDVAEAALKRFLAGKIAVHDVRIDSEEALSREGERVRVSVLEITLVRTPSAA
jgi:DNA-binding protein Alba